MSGENLVLLVIGMVAQWITAAAMIWLTWWAAQSRDAPALRVIAMVLVIVPALLWPFLTMRLSLDTYGSASRGAFLFGVSAAGIALLRALFLVIWAIVSKDRAYLRIGGGIIAGLMSVGLVMQAVGSLGRW